MPEGATGKDVIITLCGLYNHDEVLNAPVEFSGPGVASLSMDARFSISNMSTEWGPLVGWFPVDAVTISYLRGVHSRLKAQGVERFTEKDIENWEQESAAARSGRRLRRAYHARSQPGHAACLRTRHGAGDASLAEIAKKKVAIQKAYLVSCVNSRLEDLEAAANVLKGKKVAAGVKFYLGAASKWVQEEAERRGIWQTLLDAGAHTASRRLRPVHRPRSRPARSGEVGISATNRNFKGRMGSRDAQCYLASPEVVAASAVAGYIRARMEFADRNPDTHLYKSSQLAPRPEKVEILPGFPERVQGPAHLHAAGQRQHRRDLRQGLYLPRRHDARDDGEGRHGELRSPIRRAHRAPAT